MKYLRKYSQKIQDALSKINMKYLHPGKLNKLPDDLIIELSSRCTLACKCCPNGASGIRTRPRCDLGTDTFKQICEHIDLPIRNVFLHLHGEPFLNKDICDIITMLKKRGVTSFNIFSNGYLIDTVLLKRVIEQLNGCDFNICFSAEIYDCDTYERIRYPGKWNKIWQSLEAIDATMGELDCSYSINVGYIYRFDGSGRWGNKRVFITRRIVWKRLCGYEMRYSKAIYAYTGNEAHRGQMKAFQTVFQL